MRFESNLTSTVQGAVIEDQNQFDQMLFGVLYLDATDDVFIRGHEDIHSGKGSAVFWLTRDGSAHTVSKTLPTYPMRLAPVGYAITLTQEPIREQRDRA